MVKKTATDPIKRNISKNNLNSVYGKFWAREQDEQLKIVSTEQGEQLKNSFYRKS